MLRRYRGKAIIRTRMILEKCFNSILHCLNHHAEGFNSYDWMVDGVIRQIERKTEQSRIRI